MITYSLNRRGDLPIYEYLYICIRDDILAGKLKRGEKMPSKRALAEHLSISVLTVANAYSLLQTEGYLRSVEKKGYYVSGLPGVQVPDKIGPSLNLKDADPVPELQEVKEEKFFMDFKANRTGILHFPAQTWRRFLRDALSLEDEALLKTVPYKGLLQLRTAIADYLERNRGFKVSPSRIIIGAGTEYLYSRLLQMMGNKAVLAFEEPGYKKFTAISASYGNPWVPVGVDDKGLNVDLLEESGAGIVHVSPANHFPTGIAMPYARRLHLLQWASAEPDHYIIEDDYDSEFRYHGHTMLPLATGAPDKVIYMNTFSKSLVPSLRISYMILPPQLMRRYEETMSFYSCTVSSLEQYALAKFIREGHFERHLNRMKKYYRDLRQVVVKAIADSPLGPVSSVNETNAGTHFILTVQTDLSERDVKQRGREESMLLSLVSDFCYAPQPEEGVVKIVINYAGVSREKLPEMVRRLCKVFGV